jgi:hypothetical protein
MARWQAWIGDLGSAMVNPGTPLGPAKTLSENGVSDDGRSDPLTGFSIVRADSMEAAAMASLRIARFSSSAPFAYPK